MNLYSEIVCNDTTPIKKINCRSQNQLYIMCYGISSEVYYNHYSVDFIFLSFGIMGFIVELETIRGSLMRPKWPKLASLSQIICTL